MGAVEFIAALADLVRTLTHEPGDRYISVMPDNWPGLRVEAHSVVADDRVHPRLILRSGLLATTTYFPSQPAVTQ